MLNSGIDIRIAIRPIRDMARSIHGKAMEFVIGEIPTAMEGSPVQILRIKTPASASHEVSSQTTDLSPACFAKTTSCNLFYLQRSTSFPIHRQPPNCTPAPMLPMQNSAHQFMIAKKNYHLANDGHCDGQMPRPGEPGECSVYCEVRVTYSYGEEQPYSESQCRASECKVAMGTTKTITTTWGIDASLVKAFSIGATYSYSTSVAYSLSTEQTVMLEPGECGYWTFVPVLVESCGTLTTAPVDYGSGSPFDTNPTLPALTEDGKGYGIVIFVYTNCDRKAGIDWHHPRQNPIYLVPGVSTAADAPKNGYDALALTADPGLGV
ncbi:hypothetical protein VTL71DRAFT_9320 [Oculimacula yallundae]|uniref:Uncharacterized protein n=1 Tax=Oculimacula yallundae TaxID=86028 RepID=A0ABR4BUF6_9HELO